MPTIQGKVTDPDGNPVSGESVYFEGPGSFTFAELTTNDSGNYSYNADSDKTYTMRIENPDYASVSRTVSVGQSDLTVDVPLADEPKRVVGTDDVGGGVGVYGYTDSSNEIGVKGSAPNTGYGLFTYDRAYVGNTLYADTITTVRTDTSRPDLQIQTGLSGDSLANVIIGSNYTNNDPEGGLIGGGRDNKLEGTDSVIAGGDSNRMLDSYSVIAGGSSNRIAKIFNQDSYSVIGGGKNNLGSGRFSTVAGGGGQTADTIESGNTASANWATVGGGGNNEASGKWTTVSGGRNNQASVESATVSGGQDCVASGQGATVPGGEANSALGDYSFAAGAAAYADSTSGRAFIWNDGSEYHSVDGNPVFDADSQVAGETAFGDNTFNVSAQGGVRFVTGGEQVTFLQDASAGWTSVSSRTAKTNIEPVDPTDALEGVNSMDISTWEYRDGEDGGAGTVHIGPMAEDFHEAFDVGSSDEHINAINADGVALAAVQGLSEELDERDDRIDDLKAETETLREENEQLRARNEELEARLDRIEDSLDIDAGTETGTADD